MLFYLTSRIVSALAAFLYPGYASYKVLSQRPASEEDLERWLMYWSVLGCIVGVEYLAEWTVSWIPLYSTFKAIFLLYLALPQTQGATYLYTVHLRPFFASHEGQIDQTIAEVRVRVYRFLQEKARAVWAAMINALAPGGAPASANVAPGQGQWAAAPGATQPPPTLNNPAAGPSQLLSTLWTSYGPGIIAGGAALLRQTAAATLPSAAGPTPGNTPPGSTFMGSGGVDPAERRRQLEAELAALQSVPTPPANNPARRLSSFTPSSSESSTPSMRERTNSNSGKFEEIKTNDVEGYEVDDGGPGIGGYAAGGASSSKSSGRNAGWFGGWGSSSKGSYERLKDE